MQDINVAEINTTIIFFILSFLTLSNTSRPAQPPYCTLNTMANAFILIQKPRPIAGRF